MKIIAWFFVIASLVMLLMDRPTAGLICLATSSVWQVGDILLKKLEAMSNDQS